MSPERPPSQDSGGGNLIEPTNMVLSAIPNESGHVVIQQQNHRTHQHQSTNGTYTQMHRNGSHNLVTTTKSVASTSSSPSKYVVIHQNGNGQYTASEGTTAYLTTTQSNGVGNIVLVATEPMEVSSSDQNLIVNTNGQDEELTSLTWLHDKNLIKGIVACTNGKSAAASPARQSNRGTPTSDFLEDSSVSEDNASSANSSSDQGISIHSTEYSPTATVAANGNYTLQQQPHIHQHQQSYQQHNQFHPITHHQIQYTNNNNPINKNRNHILSPRTTTTTYTTTPNVSEHKTSGIVASLSGGLNQPKTVMYNGPSGTTTLVEYKSGTNFNPSPRLISQIPLSPQRSSPPNSITVTSTTSQTPPTSSSTPHQHQHFHKKYLREQMNGSELNNTSEIINSTEYTSSPNHSIASLPTNQQHVYSTTVIDPEEYQHTPIKSEQTSFYSTNHDDSAVKELNFDSPGGTGNGKNLNSQKSAVSPKQKHPTNVPYDPMVHTTNKPPYSFSSLIFMAIEDSPEKALPVKEIYAWIVQHFPYFKTAPTGWKNSVRHNLSLNKSFLKVEKAPNMGKGSLWRVEQLQRQNLLQALARSPFHQCSAVDKLSPYKTPSTPRATDSPPTTPVKSTIDPELFPKLSKKMKEINKGNYTNNSEQSSDHDEFHQQFVYSNCSSNNNTIGVGEFYSNCETPNGSTISHYSMERIVRDCGADSIDDVNAATAMLALKHGPKVFSESFQNGSPVITSSPSEDHTYSAGGAGGSSSSGSRSHNGSENNSNGAISDVAYDSCEESHNNIITAKELEEQRRHAEGVDALLSFASKLSSMSSSAASSPAKRPASTSIEDDHISSYMENIPSLGTTANGATIITNEDGEPIVCHQRQNYDSQSYYHHLTLPSSAKKLKHQRVRPKLKRKTTMIR